MNDQPSHRSMFQDYIRAGVQASLARVQVVEHTLPELDRQQAWHLLSFALDLPEVWDETRALLLALAPKMEQAGFRQAWMVYLQEGLRMARQLGDRLAVAECQLQIGILCRLMSRYEIAKTNLIESVTLFTNEQSRQRQAYSLCELAWLEQLQHLYDDAIHHAEQALGLLEHDDIQRGICFRTLGMIEYGRRNWLLSETYHRQSIAEFERAKDNRRIAWGWQNVGIALMEQERYTEAIEHFNHALVILDSIQDSYHKAVVLVNIANTNYRSNQHENIIPRLIEAESIFSQSADYQNLARLYIIWGLTCDKLDKLEDSEGKLLTAIDYYQKIGDLALEINALDALAKNYIRRHKTTDAIALLRQGNTKLATISTHPMYSTLQKLIDQDLSLVEASQENILSSLD